MSSTEPPLQRRRGADLEKALLEAAWVELNEVGYRQLTFDSVAERAGTSKSVLYRRWDNRLELVRATLRLYRPLLSGATPNTGSLRGDVIALLEYMASALSGVRSDIIWGMVSDAVDDETQQALLRSEIGNANIKAMKTILERAKARGELSRKIVSDRVCRLPVDLNRHEMLFTGRPTSPAAIRQIVDDIFLPLVKG